MPAHAGLAYTYTTLSGTPLLRASSAAAPAVLAKSTLPLASSSLALLLPWLCTQRTAMPSRASSCSSQPLRLRTKLEMLYVA